MAVPAVPSNVRLRHAARALALAAACLAGSCVPVAAGDGSAERALRERGRGTIVALESLVRQVSAQLPGRLLEAELEEDDGRLVYELTWLLPDGRRLEIELDARDGTWLSLQGPRLETAFRRAPAAAQAPKPGDKR
ncbi:PepSY domain-containing protein [Azohydromonas aeria]|uniref:PepSY domain-containing protein n=1 Tax=Azohydromonas aeria TaxID=2590212 RepID=UPI0012F79314|nr:PepSY domain-containing protein [Azohydromonas aeria]